MQRRLAQRAAQRGEAADLHSSLNALDAALQRLEQTAAPRSDSPGTSPFFLPLFEYSESRKQYAAKGHGNSTSRFVYAGEPAWGDLLVILKGLLGKLTYDDVNREVALAGSHGARMLLAALRDIVGSLARADQALFVHITKLVTQCVSLRIESNTLAPGSFHRSIPAEILREILIHVVAENPERSPSRLRALARVNRHFNVPATAEMWRSVSFHYEAKTTKFLAAAATRKERDEAMQTNFVCIHHQAADVARVVAACVGLRSLEISDSAVDFDFLSTLNASSLETLILRNATSIKPLETYLDRLFILNLKDLQIYESDLGSLPNLLIFPPTSRLARLAVPSIASIPNSLPSLAPFIQNLTITNISSIKWSDFTALHTLTIPVDELPCLLPARAPHPPLKRLVLSFSLYQRALTLQHTHIINQLVDSPLGTGLNSIRLETSSFGHTADEWLAWDELVTTCAKKGIELQRMP